MMSNLAPHNQKPYCSLSLDLDNLWAYLKIHGDKWQSLPSFFPLAIPRILDILDQHNLNITFFIVGQDAANKENSFLLRTITENKHELGNHSFHHAPNIQTLTDTQAFAELKVSHQHICDTMQSEPIGFRSPAFISSSSLLKATHAMNYQFDATILPTCISPIARLYYRLTQNNKLHQQQAFGKFSNVILPNKPYHWEFTNAKLLEIPITTMPILRTPFHLTYILWLSQFSKSLALFYFDVCLRLCKQFNITPSILLHPPDFIDIKEAPQLHFFPAINMKHELKLEIFANAIEIIRKYFLIVPMSKHVSSIADMKLRSQSLQ